MLCQEQIDQYHQEGFLVLDQIISTETLMEIKSRAAEIVEQWEPNTEPAIFTTNDNNRSGDHYFLQSAERVSCFFEEEAFDKQGNLVNDKSLCINKIGHGLHELDPVFKAFSHLPVLGVIAQELGIKEPQIRQSMYIFKQPKIGGVVNWHQDATFFYTTPQTVVTFWFAIEDANLSNGCLWVEPKGHLGPLRERFNRDGDNVSMITLDNTPWPDEKSGEPVAVKAGSLVIFHGLLPHYSAPNRSSQSRQAYTIHVTDGKAKYAKENWLQTKSLPLRGFNN